MTDRAPNGKFVSGNKGGPGRTPKAVEEKVTALIDSVVTPDDWKEVVEQLLKLAKRGDLAAITALLDRRYGKPTERKELTGADKEPLSIRVIEVIKTYAEE